MKNQQIPIIDLGPLQIEKFLEESQKTGETVVSKMNVAQLTSQQQFEKQELVKQIKDVGHNVGFFYIKNHGISQEVLNDIKKQQKLFFSLPLEQKKNYHIQKGTGYSGYTCFGEEITLGKRDMKETIEYFYQTDNLNTSQYSKYFLEDQKFPNDDVLPQFKDSIQNYVKSVNIVGQIILQLFAQAMNLPENYLYEQNLIKDNLNILRLNCYSPKQDQETQDEEFGIGIGSHVDPGWLGILNQSDVGGLQVLNKYDEWIDATPIEGTFVVNMGEMMQLASQGLFKATAHRVINRNTTEQRLSNVVFMEPNLDAVIEPINYPGHEIYRQAMIQKQKSGKSTVEVAKGLDLDFEEYQRIIYGQEVLKQYQRSYPEKQIE